MTINRIIWIFLALSCLFSACKKEQSPEGEDPIARAYNNYLYPSDLKKYFGKELNRPDSAILVNSYIVDWAKEQVLQRQAYDNIDADEEILKLVQDYRATLIRAKYEERLLRKHLDTTITEESMEAYHSQFKGQFPLSDPAVKFYFIRMPKDHQMYNQVRRLMRLNKETDLDQLVTVSAQNNFSFSFEDDWYYFNQLAAKLPPEALTKSAVVQGKDQVLSARDQNYRYLIRINEVVPKGEATPLELVQNSLKRVILKQKKIETLETVTNQIYKNELNKNKVEVY